MTNKWVIDKQFSFCYGHRVWSQKLEAEFCELGDYQCKCRHLHGHEGLVHVFLESDALERGMVTDFKHLGWLKNFVDSILDHKFVVDINDPMFADLVCRPYLALASRNNPFIYEQNTSGYDFVQNNCVAITVPETDYVAAYSLDMTKIAEFADSPEFEVLDGFTIVDFVPTSENFCKWMYDLVDAKMKRLGVKTARIDWFETPKSRSSYQGQ